MLDSLEDQQIIGGISKKASNSTNTAKSLVSYITNTTAILSPQTRYGIALKTKLKAVHKQVSYCVLL